MRNRLLTLALLTTTSLSYAADNGPTTRIATPIEAAGKAEAAVEAARARALESVSAPIRNTTATTSPATTSAATQPAVPEVLPATGHENVGASEGYWRDGRRDGDRVGGYVDDDRRGGTVIIRRDQQPQVGSKEDVQPDQNAGTNQDFTGPGQNASGPGVNHSGPGVNSSGPGTNTKGPGQNK